MPQQRTLYHQFADYYDLLHTDKDYKGEVNKLKKIIQARLQSGGNELLDVGCGTGEHVFYFQDQFFCTGIDLNEGMLKVARKKANKASFYKGEMENFDFNKKFDVITCLYGSISYSLNIPGLKKTLNNLNKHLKPGGVMIVEPYLTRSQFRPNRPKLSTMEFENIKIARVSLSRRTGNMASRKMIITIAEKDKGVFSFEDNRKVALFDKEQIMNNMERTGLRTEYFKNGITKDFDLYIGIKNS